MKKKLNVGTAEKHGASLYVAVVLTGLIILGVATIFLSYREISFSPAMDNGKISGMESEVLIILALGVILAAVLYVYPKKNVKKQHPLPAGTTRRAK